ncbi:acetyltransferase [Holdemanella biformis]|uniref:acetyltransferase n=1 Tax=Holdemanella biformis TaxID=1735 RepID=UPI0026DF70EC|nr:acetyltransferase [Holdemanella biformis]
MKDIYIVGAGGFGREVLWLIQRINNVNLDWNIKGFIDDNKSIQNTTIDDYPVVGTIDDLKTIDGYVVVAIGNSHVKKNVVERIKSISNVKFATLIDPSVIISNRVNIGEGCIICAGNIITVDITIGNHVILNLDCTVGHDAKIYDYVTINPSVNVSGNTVVGECCEIGTGTKIIQGKKIMNNIIVGAGATVVKDLVEIGTYVGCPAKRIIK